MNIETEMMKNQRGNIPYEQPSLKKYGMMKDFTLNQAGSRGDAMGGDGNTAPNDVSINRDDAISGGDFGLFGADDSANEAGGDKSFTLEDAGAD